MDQTKEKSETVLIQENLNISNQTYKIFQYRYECTTEELGM